MKTLKEIKESNKSIVLYNEYGYLILTDKNVQTDEIVMEYINKAKDTDIIEVYEDEELITVVLQTMENQNLELQWKELNKQFTMSETSSITSDLHTGFFNAYKVVDKGNYEYDYIKKPFYYVVQFKRNKHGVFCIPISIEKKWLTKL